MKIRLEEHNQEWQINFQKEKQRLVKALVDVAMEVEHIGSTSIAGLAAKPIIDILIGLHDFSIADAHIPSIEKLDYRYMKQYEEVMPFRRFFIQEQHGIRTHHIHMVLIHGEFWKRHLAFRDYLHLHPVEKLQYETLKKELSQREWIDENDYAAAKSAFIREIERKANG